jgi:hypothetical protein
MEAFFSSLKSELADRFESCGEAKTELFDYIEVFYNQRRRHSTIGYLSPAAFERRSHRSGVPLDGALVGRLAPAPSFLAHADDRLHDVLRPLTTEMNGPSTMADAH